MIDKNDITRKAYDQKNEIIDTADEMSREITNNYSKFHIAVTNQKRQLKLQLSQLKSYSLCTNYDNCHFFRISVASRISGVLSPLISQTKRAY